MILRYGISKSGNLSILISYCIICIYHSRIYSDYSSDNSEHILDDWLKRHGDEYGAVYLTMNSNHTGYDHLDEQGSEQWSQSHIEHVIELRDKALDFGRELKADYLLVSTSKNPTKLK